MHDQILVAKSEEELQKLTYTLNSVMKGFNMKISEQKTKVMAFLGKYPVRSKIVVDNKLITQVSQFNYLRCNISHYHEVDPENKINRF